MVLFNHATREMTAKIVYYGPGLCGKTTNLMVIFDKLDAKSRGKMLSLATKTDRTLFFDLLPVDVGRVGPFNLRIQLYTVPGQVFYNETRKLVLKGADSVVFVADSQPSMVDSNRESFTNLLENLQENQIDPDDTPIIVQYNKRDIPGVLSVDELQATLGFAEFPFTEASALRGDGVMETFKLASKVTAKHLLNKVKGKSSKLRKRSLRDGLPEPSPVQAPPEPVPEAVAPEPVEEVAEVAIGPEGVTVADPFADASPPAESAAPFDAAPVGADYDQVEEVSLEQLLEGRERPLTLSGNVPIPVEVEAIEEVEEVEELDVSEEIAEPVDASAIVSDPADLSSQQGEIDTLRRENERLRSALSRIADEINALLDN